VNPAERRRSTLPELALAQKGDLLGQVQRAFPQLGRRTQRLSNELPVNRHRASGDEERPGSEAAQKRARGFADRPDLAVPARLRIRSIESGENLAAPSVDESGHREPAIAVSKGKGVQGRDPHDGKSQSEGQAFHRGNADAQTGERPGPGGHRQTLDGGESESASLEQAVDGGQKGLRVGVGLGELNRIANPLAFHQGDATYGRGRVGTKYPHATASYRGGLGPIKSCTIGKCRSNRLSAKRTSNGLESGIFGKAFVNSK